MDADRLNLAARREARLPSIDEAQAEWAKKRNLARPPPSQHFHTGPHSTRALVCIGRVANTNELLEKILADLPATELVRATRVSKACRALLLASPTLQRKTFMRQPKSNTPTPHCEVVQWGPGLEQRHLKVLLPSSAASDEAIPGLSKPLHPLFEPIRVVHHPAVQMSLLCPLLEPTGTEGNIMACRLHFHAVMFGINRSILTTARFNERLLLVPSWPWAKLQISAHDGATAPTSPSTFALAPTAPENLWTHMQLSTPPTRHARVKLFWEGRVNNQLRVTLEATHCIHRSKDQSGITVHALVRHASSTSGYVAIETLTGEQWNRSGRNFGTLAACMEEIARREAWCSWVWTVGARSQVTLAGVVVPTEGELERLTETEQLSSTPLPLAFLFKEPKVEESEEDDDEDEDEEDDEEDEEEGEGNEADDEEDDDSEPDSDSTTE